MFFSALLTYVINIIFPKIKGLYHNQNVCGGEYILNCIQYNRVYEIEEDSLIITIRRGLGIRKNKAPLFLAPAVLLFDYTIEQSLNQKIHEIISKRQDDFNYIYKIKYDDDYIFTKDIDGQVPLRRETLTRIVNNELNSVGVHLKSPRKLNSRSFQIWDDKNYKT